MKSLFQLLMICSAIGAPNLQAQQWAKINPVFDPPGNYNSYYGYFADSRHGWWIAGPNSFIWYTSNGGETWRIRLEGSNVGSYIQFIDTVHGWIGGRALPSNNYFVSITKNGGRTWSQYQTPIITGITFFDSLNGFGGGDSIYATTDGGIHWAPQSVEPGHRPGVHDICFPDRKHGWAVGGLGDVFDAGMVLQSIDSGKTWHYNYPADLYCRAVYFVDSLHGCIVGGNPTSSQGVLKVTSDGGNTWLPQAVASAWLNDVIFTDKDTGWAVGEYGAIWHTTDGGVTWTSVESGTTSDLYSIFFFDHGRLGYIFGADSTLLKYEKTVTVKEPHSSSLLQFKLFQNYPNPFNPTTTIQFDLPEPSTVSLVVYDVLGRKVTELVNGSKEAGYHSVSWDASSVASGVYFARFTATDVNSNVKLRKVTKLLLAK